MRFAVPTFVFSKTVMTWRNVLQEIFGLRALEDFGVLLQFVGDLLNDEAAAIGERVMSCWSKRRALVDLENG